MIPKIGINMLRSKGYIVDVYQKDGIPSQKKLIHLIHKNKYDAVLCLLTDVIDETFLTKTPSVKIYSNYATGFNNIDIKKAKETGVVVTNAPADMSSEAVAEHTIALIFGLLARITEADRFVRAGKYKGWAPMNFIGDNISGKTLGLVGAGRIGERVAFYAKALGLKIIYTDIRKSEHLEKDYGAIYQESLDKLLKDADIVSLHVPLLDSTHHLINESKLALMKPTALLVNTSRGPIIDEKALVYALKNNIIGGAALDVFEYEPHLAKGLTKLNNVILTPHIASASVEARNQMAELAAQNIIDFFEGKKLKNIVNP